MLKFSNLITFQGLKSLFKTSVYVVKAIFKLFHQLYLRLLFYRFIATKKLFRSTNMFKKKKLKNMCL